MTLDPARLPWEEPTVVPDVPAATITDDLPIEIPYAAPEPEPEPEPAAPAGALAVVGARSLRELLGVRDPLELAAGVATIRDELVEAVRALAVETRAEHRPDTVKRQADLRAEATALSDARDVMLGIAGAFTRGADEAADYACRLIDDLPARPDANGEAHAARSLRVADGHGLDLVLTFDQRTDLSVDGDKLDDVLVASALDRIDRDQLDKVKGAEPAYLIGVRDGIAALRRVLSSSPGYRSTALDQLVRELQDAERDELAQRLARTFGRVDKGEPRPKVSHVEPAKRGRA